MDNPLHFAPPFAANKLTSYIKKYPGVFTLQAIGGIIYNTVVVLSPIFLGRIIDSAQAVYNHEGTLSQLIISILLFIAVTIVFQIARYFKRYYIRKLANLISCDMRSGLMASIFSYSMTELQKERIGDLMSRVIGDVQQVSEAVRKTITETWDTWVMMLSYLIACLIYSPRITLLAAIPIPFVLILAEMMRHPLYKYALKARKSDSKVSSHLHRTISGISILRLFGRENEEICQLKTLCQEQMENNIKAATLQNAMMPVYSLLSTIGILLVFGLGGEAVIDGRWTIGMFTSYLSMFTAMALRTNTAAKVFNGWHSAKASWDRILEKIRTNSEVIKAPEHDNQHLHVSKVTVNNLSFKYPGLTYPIIKNISFEAEMGQIIGITGAVGSGKSALASALSGLYPYDGNIQIDGIDLADRLGERSDLIAYMNQEHFLFSGSIQSNIVLNRKNDENMVTEAVYTAALDTDITQLPKGIDTMVGERGTQISGGQRQRVSLARAINSCAPILLLDDPFSACDIDTECKMINRLRQISDKRIIILFSHRLTAFESADYVMVLKNGEIAEQGTHSTLCKTDGIYSQIYKAQAFIRGSSHE